MEIDSVCESEGMLQLFERLVEYALRFFRFDSFFTNDSYMNSHAARRMLHIRKRSST